MGTRGTGVLDRPGTRGPGRGLKDRSQGHPERPSGAERGGGGETGHVSPGPARHVSHRPSLPFSVLGIGSHRLSWRLGPGLATGSGISGGSRRRGNPAHAGHFPNPAAATGRSRSAQAQRQGGERLTQSGVASRLPS